MSDQIIKPPTTSDNSLSPSLNYIGTIPRLRFDGQCLKQDKVTFTSKKVVNIYFIYEVNVWQYKQSTDLTLWNSLFFAIKLVKSTNFLKYKHSAYTIGFDTNIGFSLSNDSGLGKKVIIFGADMNLSVHIDNNKKIISWFLAKVQ